MPANRLPWNKGRLLGQKPPLKLKEIWSLRVRLQLANRRLAYHGLPPSLRARAPTRRANTFSFRAFE